MGVLQRSATFGYCFLHFKVSFVPFNKQELRQTYPAVERHSNPPAELRCLLEAPKLAMVEAVHQGQASTAGKIDTTIIQD